MKSKTRNLLSIAAWCISLVLLSGLSLYHAPAAAELAPAAIDCTWPTTREDGDPMTLDELTLLKVYGGPLPGDYVFIKSLDVTADMPCHVDMAFEEYKGKRHFGLTVVDTLGLESDFSDDVIRPVGKPSAVTGVQCNKGP